MSVLEMLRSRLSERVTTAAEVLTAAANRMAANESVDPSAVEHALAETNATVDDFERMVSLARKRRMWKADLDRGPAARARLEKAQATAERERAQFEKIQTAWFARAAELDAEISSATAVDTTAQLARQQLVEPANVPHPTRSRLEEAHAAKDEADARVEKLQREIREAKEIKNRHEGFAAHHTEFNTRSPDGTTGEEHAQRARRAERRVNEFEGELAIAAADATDAAKELAEAQAAALKA